MTTQQRIGGAKVVFCDIKKTLQELKMTYLILSILEGTTRDGEGKHCHTHCYL